MGKTKSAPAPVRAFAVFRRKGVDIGAVSLAAAWLLGFAHIAGAVETTPPAADYVCAYGCRASDANPRLEIEGEVARCWNELGGLYVGRFQAPDVVACFRKTGRLRDGGARIEWSDGVLWRRH